MKINLKTNTDLPQDMVNELIKGYRARHREDARINLDCEPAAL